MDKTAEQMMELMRAGVILGGAHHDQDKDGALLYYHKDGQYYMGNASNGGPSATDESLTGSKLKERLVGHFNSISEEEYARDAKDIQGMYQKIIPRW